uniref:Cysteine proteinase inhibitor n=1 Tax=Oryza barthii TaxID=65489 RepID=A0A0D3FFA7_9ORYZ
MAMTTRTLLLRRRLAPRLEPDKEHRRPAHPGARQNNRVSPSDELTFHRVTGGEQQVVSGMNYRLEIEAASGGGDVTGSYGAVVFEQEWSNTRKLISFDKNHNF